MKKITSIIFTLIVLASSSGHCSYIADYGHSELAELIDQHHIVARCFMVIDMVESTKNKEEKKRLKTVLKVELTFLQDCILQRLEEYEQGLIYWENEKSKASPNQLPAIESSISYYKEQFKKLDTALKQVQELLKKAN